MRRREEEARALQAGDEEEASWRGGHGRLFGASEPPAELWSDGEGEEEAEEAQPAPGPTPWGDQAPLATPGGPRLEEPPSRALLLRLLGYAGGFSLALTACEALLVGASHAPGAAHLGPLGGALWTLLRLLGALGLPHWCARPGRAQAAAADSCAARLQPTGC